eukprot:gene11083-7712_t
MSRGVSRIIRCFCFHSSLGAPPPPSREGEDDVTNIKAVAGS